MKTVYTISEDLYGIDLDTIKVGQEYILTERTDIVNGNTFYRLWPDDGVGIPGNMNGNICRYHGWRGTTNDISTTALGVRRVERVDIPKGEWPYRTVKVKLSADLKPEED